MKWASNVSLIVVTALGLSGCAVFDSASSSPAAVVQTTGAPQFSAIPTPQSDEHAPGELSQEVAQGVVTVRDYATHRYPHSYSGIATGTSESADRLVIYLVGSDARIEEDLLAISGVADPTKVVFREGWQSVSASDALNARVNAAVPKLQTDGVRIQSYGVGVDGVEEIGVSHLTGDQVNLLMTDFGPYLRVSEQAENSYGRFVTESPAG